jgi:hypothetical protein
MAVGYDPDNPQQNLPEGSTGTSRILTDFIDSSAWTMAMNNGLISTVARV